MPPQTAKSLMKEFRASFRRKKSVDTTPKIDKAKELEEEELAKLSELKENLGGNIPQGYNDADLLGFIRARSLNTKEAEKLLKLDVNLKKIILLDTLVEDYDVTDLSKNFSVSGVIGCDKDGSLVRVMKIGQLDIKGCVHTMSTIEHFKVLVWFLEQDRKRLEVENRKSGRKNTQICYIIDLKNLNISNFLQKPVIDTGIVALKLLQDHYHDIPKSIYIVNAPGLFPSAFKMFRPVIQDALHQKIKIYGSDGYKEELLKHIDADVLPAYLGGNKLDINDDPTCLDLIGVGGDIPHSYYADHFLDPEEEGVEVITVAAGSSLSYRYPIPEEGTVVHFHVQAKENDICIGVYLDKDIAEEIEKRKKDEDVSKLEPLVPIIRTQCHLCPEYGSFVTWFTGTLVFYVDNSYSWMSSKEITLKLTVEPPTSNKKHQEINHIRSEVMVPANRNK